MMKTLVGSAGQLPEHFHHFVGEGTRGHNAILRTLELRRRDHFHGLGDLLRILNRLDASSNV